MTKQEEKIIENLKKRSQAEARITLRFIEKLQNDNYKLDRENQHLFDRIQDLQKENEELKSKCNSFYGMSATDFIIKDKIRDKIKELEENSSTVSVFEIDDLKELLGE